jgi:hypothetical protein
VVNVRNDAEISLELRVHVPVLPAAAERESRLPSIFLESGDGSTDGLRKIAVLEELVCHKLGVASAGCGIPSDLEG